MYAAGEEAKDNVQNAHPVAKVGVLVLQVRANLEFHLVSTMLVRNTIFLVLAW